jgi:hypothetical protein
MREVAAARVELPSLQQRVLRRRRSARHLDDGVAAPALTHRDLAHHPSHERGQRGHAHALAPEIGHGLDRPVGQHGKAGVERRPGHRGDALHRRALGDEAQIEPDAQSDIDAAGRQRLLLLRRPAERRGLDGQPFGGEEAALHAEIEQHEGEGLRDRLANPHRRRGAGRRRDQCRERQCDQRLFHHLSPHARRRAWSVRGPR